MRADDAWPAPVTQQSIASPQPPLRSGPQAPPAIGAGLEATRAPLRRARHLPGYPYTSPEVLALEKERVFMKDWLCVVRAERARDPAIT